MEKSAIENTVKTSQKKREDKDMELTSAIINNEVSHLSDIYHLFNKTVNSLYNRTSNFLLFSKDIDVTELYNEAFIEGHWIDVNADLNVLYKVMLTVEPSVTVTTKHLLSALAHSDENTVHYVGNHPTRSIRSATYRLLDFYKGKVSVRDIAGVTVVSKIEDKYDKEQLFHLLNVMQYGVKFDIDIDKYPSVAILRSLLQTYGDKHGCKFTTKVVGRNLTVVKTLLDKPGVVNKNPIIAREYLRQIPYDTEIIVNWTLFKDLSECKIKALLRNQSSGIVSFKDNRITKHSFKLVRNSGMYELFHLGKSVYSTSGDLDKFERASIKTILKPHNMTLVGTKIVKVNYE